MGDVSWFLVVQWRSFSQLMLLGFFTCISVNANNNYFIFIDYAFRIRVVVISARPCRYGMLIVNEETYYFAKQLQPIISTRWNEHFQFVPKRRDTGCNAVR